MTPSPAGDIVGCHRQLADLSCAATKSGSMVPPTVMDVVEDGDREQVKTSGAMVEVNLEPDGVGWLWLNRPDRLNAVSEGLYEELIAGIQRLHGDGAGAVVLAGRGRAFCAGADLKAHQAGRTADEQLRYVTLGQEAARTLHRCPVPVVAAVHGYAVGAGAELALNADLVVTSDDARFRFPELGLASYVGGGATSLLPALIGTARARQLLYLGDWLDADQAQQLGLVHARYATDELHRRAADIARRLAGIPRWLFTAAKRHLAEEMAFEEALARESEILLTCLGTPAWSEGVNRFFSATAGPSRP